MKSVWRFSCWLLVSLLSLPLLVAAEDLSGVLTIGDYTLVSKTRFGRTDFEYVFRASIRNTGSNSYTGVSATLVAPIPQGMSVVDGALAFGAIGPASRTDSGDTFTFRQNRVYGVSNADLRWQITGDVVAPAPVIVSQGHIDGLVRDTLGQPVVNAEVSIGDHGLVTQTGLDGGFSANFGAGEISSGGVVLVATHPAGYVSTQRKVMLGQDSHYNVTLVVKGVGVEQPISNPHQNPAGVVESGKAELQLPAGSIVDSHGDPVTEPVTVRLTALDPTNPQERAVFPGGDFLAVDPGNPPASGETLSLESVVLAEVTLQGSSGAQYHQLASPAALQLVIPDSLQARYNPGDTIPLWFYDASTGLWRREGDATVALHGDGKKWAEASVTHFSWWNVDHPIAEHACLKFKPVDAATAQTLSSLTYYLDGIGYVGRSQGVLGAGDEIGINGKLNAPGELVYLYLMTGASTYPLQQDAVDPDLYLLVAHSTQARVFTLPAIQGNYTANPENCADLGTIRIDMTIPSNSPPNVTINHPGGVTCGASVTITASVSDPDNNLPVIPNPIWETECGVITNPSLNNVEIAWKGSPGDCEVRLSVADEMGATGVGSTVVDCMPSIWCVCGHNPDGTCTSCGCTCGNHPDGSCMPCVGCVCGNHPDGSCMPCAACVCGGNPDGSCMPCGPCACGNNPDGTCTPCGPCACEINPDGSCAPCMGCACGHNPPDGSCAHCAWCHCGANPDGSCMSCGACACGVQADGLCMPCLCDCDRYPDGSCMPCLPEDPPIDPPEDPWPWGE